MPTEAKQAAVAELVELLKETDTTIVSDHRGLSVADLLKVRRELREKGIRYRVIKNRLARIAADEAGRSELIPLLEGPSAIAYGADDESTLAKGLLDATKAYKVEIRGAAMNGETVDEAAVKALAALPGRDALLAQLVGGMASPLSTMASLLAAPLRDLGYALAQLVEQRESSGDAPSAETAEAAQGAEDAEATASAASDEATEGAQSAEDAEATASAASDEATEGAQSAEDAEATASAASDEATEGAETADRAEDPGEADAEDAASAETAEAEESAADTASADKD